LINENDESVDDISRMSGRASNAIKAANAFTSFPLTAAESGQAAYISVKLHG